LQPKSFILVQGEKSKSKKGKEKEEPVNIKFEWSWETSKRAECWSDFYDCIPDRGGEYHGIPHMACNACHTRYLHPNLRDGRSTSSIKRHCENCPKLAKTRDQRDPEKRDLFAYWFRTNDRDVENKALVKITDEHVTQAVLDFFISGDIPFHQASNLHFQHLISLIRVPVEETPKDNSRVVRTKQAETPSRKVLRARLDEHVAIAKEQLRDELIANDSAISLALDLWTGGANYAFMGSALLILN
jgi:hypothetical protein